MKCMQKMNVIAKIRCILPHYRYIEIVHRIFKHNDTHYTILTLDKNVNSLIYRTLFCINIYGTHKLSKSDPVVLPHPAYVPV